MKNVNHTIFMYENYTKIILSQKKGNFSKITIKRVWVTVKRLK